MDMKQISLDISFEEYESLWPEEINCIGLFHNFIKSSSHLTEAQKRGHLTASAWIMNFDRTKILLTHHGKLHKWFQLGGHLEEGETLLDGAKREAQEESGLKSLQILNRAVFDIDAHLIPAGKNDMEHYHFDIRFLFQADSDEPLRVSSESKDLRWVTPAEAEKLNSSESIGRMIRKMDSLEPNVFGEIEPGVAYTSRQGAYGLLLNNKRELALVRVPLPTQCFLPGGGIEAEEDHTQCLKREFVEETGLEVSVKEFLGTSVQYVYAQRQRGHYKIIGHMYRCELLGQGEGKTEEDHELVWIPLEKAQKTMAMGNQKWAVDKLINLHPVQSILKYSTP